MNAFIGGSASTSQTNTSLKYNISKTYILTKEVTTLSETNNDITIATSLEALYADTTNFAGAEKTMAAAFTDVPYWVVDGTAVYWHTRVPQPAPAE